MLKFIPQEAQTDDSGMLLARFGREVWNASRLQSEFFVPAHKPSSGNPYYYVMDYVEAPSLRFLLKSRRLSTEEAVGLGKFLCRAGQFLLRHELVHGDIKPDNLLVFREGDDISFKLLDLGLASTAFTDASTSGTATYLAPERFGRLPGRTDRDFFHRRNSLRKSRGRSALRRHRTISSSPAQPPVGLSKLNPNVPPWLESVIEKSLSVRQEQRYQAYSELFYALTHPEEAPWNVRGGSLLERNPLAFYRAGFWLLLASTLLLTLYLILLCHR